MLQKKATSVQPVASEADAEEEAPARKAPAEPVVTSETSGDDTKEDKPKRGGWWQRGRSFF